jgi:SAM-dependent methyltransferase
MSASTIFGRSLLVLSLGLVVACATAQSQTAQEEFKPYVGQEGKDVVWVPTPQALVDRMLDLAKVTPKDYVIDLGSGDGRTVITAAKRGARALGVEYNPNMVDLSRRNAANEGMTGKAVFVQGDIFETDFSKATVITLFLLPDLNIKLRPQILDMRAGTRVVSNSFTMGEWESDDTASATEDEGCSAYCTAYLWIVPAKVEGRWKTSQGELRLDQQFQRVVGSLAVDGKLLKISDGRLNGNELAFTAGTTKYLGRVTGDTIEGTFSSGSATGRWSARRS